MDKSVLLVLLLQVFLLITAFTSADAAALVTDPQRPPDLVGRRNDGNREVFGNRRKRQHFLSNCSWRAGACGLAGSRGVERPQLPTRPSPEELFKYLNGKDPQRARW